MQSSDSNEGLPDLITIIAIAVVAYALANVLHEGLGHGGACLLVGGKPIALSSLHFECDAENSMRAKIVASAGSIVNAIAGAVAFILLRRLRGAKPESRFFLWLFMTINLLMASGYLLFSGIGKIGDWAKVCEGLPPIIWRPVMALLGAALYFLSARFAAFEVQPLLGDDALRMARAKRLTLGPYITGGLLYCGSGLFNPVGPILIAISAAAASLGGTSGLLWLTELIRERPGIAQPIAWRRSMAWIITAAIVALVFVGVLGPGLKL